MEFEPQAPTAPSVYFEGNGITSHSIWKGENAVLSLHKIKNSAQTCGLESILKSAL